MAVSINISDLISGAVTNLFDSAVIIGLPVGLDAPAPTFCLCEIPGERGRASARLPGNLTQAGEFRARTVIEASTMELDIVLSDIPASKNQNIFRAIQIVLNNAALVTNSIATFGAILPNLSGASVGYVASCLSVLNQMKNYMQPIMILGSYIPLGVLQQTTPYLSSSWYIEEISPPHEAGQAGVALTLKLREQFTIRTITKLGAVLTVASETVAPNKGASIGGLL
jgi:hypothetical protein